MPASRVITNGSKEIPQAHGLPRALVHRGSLPPVQRSMQLAAAGFRPRFYRLQQHYPLEAGAHSPRILKKDSVYVISH